MEKMIRGSFPIHVCCVPSVLKRWKKFIRAHWKSSLPARMEFQKKRRKKWQKSTAANGETVENPHLQNMKKLLKNGFQQQKVYEDLFG